MAVMLNRRPAPRGSFSFARSGFQIPKATTTYKPPAISSDLAARMKAMNPSGVVNLGWNFPQGFNPYGQESIQDFSGRTGSLVNPDYGAMIGGDWEVQDAEAAMGERMASLRSSFQTNLRQALVDLGVTDTSKLGSLGQYIDADTIQKAAENKYSTQAQIAQAEARQNAQTQAALAGRGLLSSGQLTKSSGDITAKAEQGRYDALRSFLESGASGLNTIADNEYQMARGIAQARAAAAARAAEWGMMYGGGYSDAYADPITAPEIGNPMWSYRPAPVRAPAKAAPVPAWKRALMLRSQAMNRRYGLG